MGSLVLLAGAAADRLSVRPPPGSAAYHARIRDEAARVPLTIGEWVGQDCPIPAEASKLLRPNVVVSRIFHDSTNGRSVGFLLVQCTDVRDIVCHYPPVCYPYRGLSLVVRYPRDWNVNGTLFTGTEYQFESSTLDSPALTVVENFMILPNGHLARDMGEVAAQLRLRTRYLGAAQVQVIFQSDTSLEERNAICARFIVAHMPLIDAIRSGVQQ